MDDMILSTLKIPEPSDKDKIIDYINSEIERLDRSFELDADYYDAYTSALENVLEFIEYM